MGALWKMWRRFCCVSAVLAVSLALVIVSLPTAALAAEATGENFPDALAAGALAGKKFAPLLLVDGGGSDAASFMSLYKGSVKSPKVIGGSSAVTNGANRKLADALGL